MNRVRMVAIVAAALAVAVGAGTLFQADRSAPPRLAEGPAGSGAATGQVSLVEQLGAAPARQPDGETAALAEAGAAIDPPESIELTALVAEEPAAAPVDEMPLRLASPPFQSAPVPAGAPLALSAADAAAGVTDDEAAELALPIAPMLLDAGGSASAGNTAPDVDILPADDALLAEIEACARWLVVTAEPGAMLDLSLFAPCDAGAMVRLEHAGLQFDSAIEADGQLALSLPALDAEGAVMVTFADDESLGDAAAIADLALHDRVVLQWQGAAPLALNAYEFEADFGTSGHIRPENAGAPGQALQGALVQLGVAEPAAQSRQAQVYSFPTGLSARLGQVELELEVAVTEASCGQELAVGLLPLLSGEPGEGQTISLTMPECDGEGGFLVLKNLLPDLTIALN